MRCIERQRAGAAAVRVACTALAATCAVAQAAAAAAAAAPAHVSVRAPAPVVVGTVATAVKPQPQAPVHLPPPPTPADADELRLLFARRLVAAHPETSYTTPAPERLLAIPVLEVQLNADGSVRRIVVLRKPTTGSEATALAIAAVRRAAPYGNVSRLPKPWKVVETFLFDDRLHFKPRTLDL